METQRALWGENDSALRTSVRKKKVAAEANKTQVGTFEDEDKETEAEGNSSFVPALFFLISPLLACNNA